MNKLSILNGPEIGQVFELKKDITYIGRSPDNDIRISDRTVSRRHLKITRNNGKYSITDLESRNRTFFDGKYLSPGIEVEVKQGIPIAIGMSVICVGEGCLEHMLPFLDLMVLTRMSGQGGIWEDNRDKTNQKILELLYNVSDILAKNLPIRKTTEQILDHIFDLLKRIDRGAFILLDTESKEIKEIVFRSKTSTDDPSTSFSRDVLNRVIEERRPVVVLDTHTEEDEDLADTLELSKIRSVLCVPLISGSQILGALYFDSLERPYGFRKEDICLFMDLSQRTALAMEYAELARELSQIADELPSGN